MKNSKEYKLDLYAMYWWAVLHSGLFQNQNSLVITEKWLKTFSEGTKSVNISCCVFLGYDALQPGNHTNISEEHVLLSSSK
jgi:hypothetical protein